MWGGEPWKKIVVVVVLVLVLVLAVLVVLIVVVLVIVLVRVAFFLVVVCCCGCCYCCVVGFRCTHECSDPVMCSTRGGGRATICYLLLSFCISCMLLLFLL